MNTEKYFSWLPPLLLITTIHTHAANDQTLQSTSTEVKLTVTNGCMLNNSLTGPVNLGNLNFGAIYKTNIAIDTETSSGSGSINLRCTPGTTAKLTMNTGLHGSNINDRKMKINSGTSTLSYQLYTAANRQTVWDDTTGLSIYFDSDTPKIFTIYGRILPQTTPISGVYSDQVTITLSY